MKKALGTAAVTLGLCLSVTQAGQAADLPGSKDPAFLKRFQGAEIVNYESLPFERLMIAAPDPKTPPDWVTSPAEGQVTRIVYHLPSGHTVLEVLRNYEEELKSAGLAQVDEKRGDADVRDFPGPIYYQSWENNRDFNWTNLGLAGMAQYGYVTANGDAGGKPVRVQVFVGTYRSPVDVTYKNKVHFNSDEPVVIVDTVTALPLPAAMGTGPSKADIPGGKDPASLKRFRDSAIIAYRSVAYDELNIAAPDAKNAWHVTPYEGGITRTVYQLPASHGVLEVLRDYEQALKDAGLSQADEIVGYGNMAQEVIKPVYYQGWETSRDFAWANSGSGTQQFAYLTAAGTQGGHAVKAAVLIITFNDGADFTAYKKPVHVAANQPLVIVDIVTSKDLVNQMVTVKAADMAAALAKSGVVDLYGVYFDTDKTEVKLESAPTLAEVATLMKSQPSLKLEVSGHTDNTGTKDHNMTLSQGRADAVVKLLATKYGIDPSRLVAKGYGDTKPVASNATEDGKAKNRRVELRKL